VRELLAHLVEQSVSARARSFKRDSYANWLRDELPAQIRQSLGPAAVELEIEGHPGKGSWAFTPWVGLRHEQLAGEKWTSGYYVCYLVNTVADGLVLSIQIGIDSVRMGARGTRGVGKKRQIAEEAQALAQRLAGGRTRFLPGRIQLGATNAADRVAFYEYASVLSRAYRLPLPSDGELRDDLSEMINAYLELASVISFPELEHVRPLMPNHAHVAHLAEEDLRRLRVHVRAERNSKLAAEAKRLSNYRCEVCEFHFRSSYGVLSEDYIEAHHKTPFSSLPRDRPVLLSAIDDFAVLCANCHRAIHLVSPMPSVEEFREACLRRSTREANT
jgi:5-methylcytosine-specific restriction enzyme A